MPSKTKEGFLSGLNVKKRCKATGVGLWQCPHFLFIIMGLVIIAAIITTDLVARSYAEPEVSALIVLAVSALLFIIGNTIVRSFENIVEASRLKSEFVSIVSHELRSPLSAVKWSLDLLRTERDSPKIANEANSIIASVDEQNEKMIRIVNDLLEVRRAEEKKIDIQPENVSLKKLTEDTIKTLDSFARASNIMVEMKADGDLTVRADPKKLGLALSALLENAIRYSPGGGRAKIEIYEKGREIFWQVADYGSGIPKEEQPKVFEKFFRSHNAYRYRSGGLGIGLFLSKAFIEAMGGGVGFSSEEGKGSIFWFWLPKLEISS